MTIHVMLARTCLEENDYFRQCLGVLFSERGILASLDHSDVMAAANDFAMQKCPFEKSLSARISLLLGSDLLSPYARVPIPNFVAKEFMLR